MLSRPIGWDDPTEGVLMSSVVTTIEPQGSVASSTEEEQRNAYELALDLIVSETGCSIDEAVRTVQWVKNFVDRARSDAYQWQYPTDQEMAGREYPLVDIVMGHDAVAAEGSAHAALQVLLLDPSKDEYALVHAQVDEEPHYCTVQVALRVMN